MSSRPKIVIAIGVPNRMPERNDGACGLSRLCGDYGEDEWAAKKIEIRRKR
jgi:hypothetical protein